MKTLAVFLLFICLPRLAWAQTAPAPAFKAEIAIAPGSLWHYPEHDDVFTMDTTITNISDKDQDIIVWTQEGWSWVSDNLSIVPDTAALSNIKALKTLKPGEEYKGGFNLHIGSDVKRPVTFRLGFHPKASMPVSFQDGIEKSGDLIWSNAVTFDRAVIKERALSLGMAMGK